MSIEEGSLGASLQQTSPEALPRIELSPEQKAIVDSFGKGMAVLAGAGTGKTTTLVQKCGALIRRNPEARFAAVSFTEKSTFDLREKLAARLTSSKNWVMTIHGLCAALIQEFPREAGIDGAETVLSESEQNLLWERAIEALWFQSLSEDVQQAVERLLDRETRLSLVGLLKRVRSLISFGVLDRFDESDADARALKIVFETVYDRYERLKQRRGVLDFDDLEIRALRALQEPRVQQAFHKRFDLVLVDEFQDTNPIQAKIIWLFVKPDRSNLCVVGDPKQSIYRFRDADVSLFEELCAQLPESHSLTWNFRSRPGVIEFVNRVSRPAFEASQMQYDALEARRDTNAEFSPVERLEIRNPDELAQYIQEQTAKGVPLEDMALLLRKIRGNEKWLDALKRAGIPMAIGSGGLFWEDPRVREMVAFLKWWHQPSNALSGAVFLRAPWVSVSDSEIDEWIRVAGSPGFEKEFFDSDHALALRLKPLFGKVLRPGQLLLELLVDAKVESEIGAPLLGLWHRCEELSFRGLDFAGVVRELSLSLEESRREREVPPPKNLGQLRILTLHGAKGLEFPHVILVDFEGKTRAAASPLLFWDRKKGAFLSKRKPNGDRDKDAPEEKAWREEERRKNVAESKRVFYVALTRARERLVVVRLESEESRQKPALTPKPESYLDDDWWAWLELGGGIRERVELSNASPPSQGLELNAGTSSKAHSNTLSGERVLRRKNFHRARHSVTEWNLMDECPRAYEWRFVRPVFSFSSEKPAQSSNPEVISRADLGTRVHSCFETGRREDFFALEEEVGRDVFSAGLVWDWVTKSSLMKPASIDADRDVWTELDFEVPVEGEVVVGSMDRLVREGKRFHILDFKITQKLKSTEELLARYRGQMELYAWALARLEPPEAIEEVKASLVQVTTQGVEVHPVPLSTSVRLRNQVQDRVKLSLQIANGAPGEPRPGDRCRYCDFRQMCDASNRVVTA